MNKGVEILLERMKSNPEEFIHPTNNLYAQSKWGSLVAEYGEALDAEDIEAYKNAVREMRKEQFTQRVMEELLDPKSKDGVTLTSISHPNATQLGGATQGGYTLTSNGNKPQWVAATSASINANSLTVGNQTLDEKTIEHMKLHMEHQRKMMELQAQAEEAKKQKNISMLERLIGK